MAYNPLTYSLEHSMPVIREMFEKDTVNLLKLKRPLAIGSTGQPIRDWEPYKIGEKCCIVDAQSEMTIAGQQISMEYSHVVYFFHYPDINQGDKIIWTGGLGIPEKQWKPRQFIIERIENQTWLNVLFTAFCKEADYRV